MAASAIFHSSSIAPDAATQSGDRNFNRLTLSSQPRFQVVLVKSIAMRMPSGLDHGCCAFAKTLSCSSAGAMQISPTSIQNGSTSSVYLKQVDRGRQKPRAARRSCNRAAYWKQTLARLAHDERIRDHRQCHYVASETTGGFTTFSFQGPGFGTTPDPVARI